MVMVVVVVVVVVVVFKVAGRSNSHSNIIDYWDILRVWTMQRFIQKWN
jgi:hypothetical protein